MAEGVKGGKDITSFIYDPSPGLEKYATGLESKLNEEMRTAGYTGAAVEMPRTERAAVYERTAEENEKSLLSPFPAWADESDVESLVSQRVDALAGLRKQASAEEVAALPAKVDDFLSKNAVPPAAAERLRNAAQAAAAARVLKERGERSDVERSRDAAESEEYHERSLFRDIPRLE